MAMDIVDQVRALQNRNEELQAKWDHFQRLCQDHGAHGIGGLIVQRDELNQQRDHLERENAKQAEMLNKVIEQRDELLKAAENLVRVKGRHHTEQAYKKLEAAIAKVKEQK